MFPCAPPQLHSLQSQLEFQEQSMVEKSLVSRQEAKIRELETKLEYERTQIKRLEVRPSMSNQHGIMAFDFPCVRVCV